MSSDRRSRAAFVASGLGAAAACSGRAGGVGGAGGIPVSASASGGSRSGGPGAGGCSEDSEAFGGCLGPKGPDGGTSEPGASCQRDSDCVWACCPCSYGQTLYAYRACACGRCASVCNPVNDTRAPACADAGPVDAGCMKCAQILSEALADGAQLGPLACPGSAATAWAALSTCVAACGGAACPALMPTNPCVACINDADAMGGCSTEFTACLSE